MQLFDIDGRRSKVRREMSAVPLAYFLTFSTYGSRLPGDVRGTVEHGRAGHGEATLGYEPGLAEYSRTKMTGPAILLDSNMRRIVDDAIREQCEFRRWQLHALNVRTNHVHLVVSAEVHDADFVLRNVKARATKRLREAGLIGTEQAVWTRHGSTRIAWKDRDVVEMIDYVQQGIPLT